MKRRRWLEAALRLPLFHKIVIANATIILLAVAGTMLLGPGFGVVGPEHSAYEIAIPLGVAGVAASVLINAFIVRLALAPVRSLEATAARVKDGDLGARVPESTLADPDLAHAIEAFNEILDAAATYRRRLHESASRYARAEEAERRRVARELHEASAQRFASLLLRLRILDSECGAADDLQVLLEEARDEVADALEIIRDYALHRRPLSIDELGLGPAVESCARETVSWCEVRVRVLPEDQSAEELDPDVQLALFRIIQEALDNVARHAAANRVDIEIATDGDRVTASVTDDGEGFDLEATLGSMECLGLFEMRERAESVRGRLEVTCEPGRGTRVEVVIPSCSFERSLPPDRTNDARRRVRAPERILGLGMKSRTTFLAAATAFLFAAAPAAACLAMAHEAPVAERSHTGCGEFPEAPSVALCAGAATVVPTDGTTVPATEAVGLFTLTHPGETPAPDRDRDGLADAAPRARSAPIHLLHATFLI